MNVLFSAILVLFSLCLLTQCSKKNCDCTTPVAGAGKLSYGDSVFYLRTTDYTISPLHQRQGTFSAFPENLAIDPATGRITVSVRGIDGHSQTGLWYKILFSGINGEKDSTMILLSGLSYVDQFYQLNKHDSIIYPIYNGDPANVIPTGNYNLKGDYKFAINPANGQINIRECIRRGYFAKDLNTSWKQTAIEYAINDKSNRVQNEIDLVVYYYSTVNDVPSNVSQLMQAHHAMTLGYRSTPIPATYGAIDNNLPSDLRGPRALARPRPPCIVIIGH